MSIKTIIIIILSLYGLGSSLAFIIYLIKYSNLKSKYKQSISTSQQFYNTNCTNKYLESEDYDKEDYDKEDYDKEDYDKDNKYNKDKNKFNNESNKLNETTLKKIEEDKYLQLIQTYDIYNNADFYDKYDLYDDYNDKIIIYSKDLKNCYISCENLQGCYAFSKYHNYCYLKGKYDLNQITNASKVSLIVKKNINNLNKTLNDNLNKTLNDNLNKTLNNNLNETLNNNLNETIIFNNTLLRSN